MKAVVVAVLVGMVPSVAWAGGVVRCEIDGRTVFSNLISQCPEAVVQTAPVAKPVIKIKPKRHKKPKAKVKRKVEVARKPTVPKPAAHWWSLLGGVVAPDAVAVAANNHLRWKGVAIAYASKPQLAFAKRIISSSQGGLVVPRLAQSAVAQRMYKQLAAMQMVSLTVVPYRGQMFASLRKQGFAQIPAPQAMVSLLYRSKAGKERTRLFPFGRSAGKLYISLPYREGQ